MKRKIIYMLAFASCMGLFSAQAGRNCDKISAYAKQKCVNQLPKESRSVATDLSPLDFFLGNI